MLVDTNGNPLVSMTVPNRKARAELTNNGQFVNTFAYDSAAVSSAELGTWFPLIRSPDAEINLYRDRIVSRSRDMARNDGWANGSIMRILDNTVGTSLRLVSKPDYRALAAVYGSAYDAQWADEYRRFVEAKWRLYSTDLGNYNDVERQLDMGAMFRLALRHKLVDGDSLMLSYWLPERMWEGGAQYATAFKLVDPDRLSNPYQMVDTKYLRNGVEIDDLGVPIAYHIRKAQQNDWYNTVEAMTWERIEREEPDGWRRVIHDYERDRANQHRGIGVFTPVLAQMKMLARYYGVELQAAVIAASLGTYVKSPYDPALIQDAIAGDNEEELNFYQQMRADWNKENPAMFNGARIPTLAPGESIEQVASAHPHDQFTPFAQEMQRMFASATGLASQQITQDYSQANYSSMRAALAEVWKTLTRRGDEFKKQTATPAFAVWLEEEYERGDVPMPRKRPSYREARTLLARCKWLGPGRGYIDRTKEAEGSLMEMTIGATTLEDEVGESSGNDWEETLDQRQIETAAFKARGLPVPEWNGVVQTAGKTEGRGSHDPTSKNYEPNS